MRPIIGITSYVEQAAFGHWDVPAAIVPLTYVHAVGEAGGRPLLLPPEADAVEETLDVLDGVVFSGGADLDPSLYGAKRHPETAVIRQDRDESEAALMKAALDRGMPVLAICRGMQLLNVVRGGDLVQHLPETTGEKTHKEANGAFARHDVDIDPLSRLGSILGDRAMVASHHHQAPDRPGEGLRVVARSPDKVVEAIEDPDAKMVVGVLWHPEENEDKALFEELVSKAAEYRKERES
jgi:putative glutamine amidotransferase